jgi:hypothetical protein
MEELLRTTDPTLVPFASALLRAEHIDFFVLDTNMSIVEGSLGILPRRLMVLEADLLRARAILRDNGIEPYEGEGWL